MPSLEKITGVIVTFIILSVSTGNGEWVWKSIAYMRYHAISEARKPWGCPSMFNKNACYEWRRK